MNHILVPYHLDESLPGLDVPFDVDVTVTRELPDGDVWARMAALYDGVAGAVAGAVERGETPVVMSGDCTTSLGVLAGLRRAAVAPSIVWFDAHGDVQTLETTTSGYLGGIPLPIIAGYRPELIATGRVAAVGLACTWHPGQGAAHRVEAVTSALGDTG